MSRINNLPISNDSNPACRTPSPDAGMVSSETQAKPTNGGGFGKDGQIPNRQSRISFSADNECTPEYLQNVLDSLKGKNTDLRSKNESLLAKGDTKALSNLNVFMERFSAINELKAELMIKSGASPQEMVALHAEISKECHQTAARLRKEIEQLKQGKGSKTESNSKYQGGSEENIQLRVDFNEINIAELEEEESYHDEKWKAYNQES